MPERECRVRKTRHAPLFGVLLRGWWFAVTDWDPQPASLRDGETRDDAGHASRNAELLRAGKRELARQELEGDHHRCHCGETFETPQDLADHSCGGATDGD